MAEEKKPAEPTDNVTEETEGAGENLSKMHVLMADKKKLSALIVVAVIFLSGFGGIIYWWKTTRAALHGHKEQSSSKKSSSKTTQAATEPVEEEDDDDGGHPPSFMPIERITVKLFRGKAPVDHYLQVSMDLKLSNHNVSEKVKQYLPIIQHETMLILSSKEFDWLDDMGHKKKLALEIRDKINKILKAPSPKEDGVKAVYFNSFIVQ
jgi:flagellar protein FliL